MGSGYVIKEYITRKEACEIIGIAESTMTEHFKRIRLNYPNSIVFRGKVNRRDFENYFNIGNSYRK